MSCPWLSLIEMSWLEFLVLTWQPGSRYSFSECPPPTASNAKISDGERQKFKRETRKNRIHNERARHLTRTVIAYASSCSNSGPLLYFYDEISTHIERLLIESALISQCWCLSRPWSIKYSMPTGGVLSCDPIDNISACFHKGYTPKSVFILHPHSNLTATFGKAGCFYMHEIHEGPS